MDPELKVVRRRGGTLNGLVVSRIRTRDAVMPERKHPRPGIRPRAGLQSCLGEARQSEPLGTVRPESRAASADPLRRTFRRASAPECPGPRSAPCIGGQEAALATAARTQLLLSRSYATRTPRPPITTAVSGVRARAMETLWKRALLRGLCIRLNAAVHLQMQGMSDEPEYRALTLRMPPGMHAAVRASAAAHERSWGGEVRAIVREHFNREVEQRSGLRDRRPALDASRDQAAPRPVRSGNAGARSAMTRTSL